MSAEPGAVADASAIAALLFGEPRAGEAAEALGGKALLAPTLLPYEVGSVLLKKLALYPTEARKLRKAFGLFDRLEIRLVAVPWVEVADLAAREELTFYDAAYLWLARAFGCELVTLDERLAAAAAGS